MPPATDWSQCRCYWHDKGAPWVGLGLERASVCCHHQDWHVSAQRSTRDSQAFEQNTQVSGMPKDPSVGSDHGRCGCDSYQFHFRKVHALSMPQLKIEGKGQYIYAYWTWLSFAFDINAMDNFTLIFDFSLMRFNRRRKWCWHFDFFMLLL